GVFALRLLDDLDLDPAARFVFDSQSTDRAYRHRPGCKGGRFADLVDGAGVDIKSNPGAVSGKLANESIGSPGDRQEMEHTHQECQYRQYRAQGPSISIHNTSYF